MENRNKTKKLAIDIAIDIIGGIMLGLGAYNFAVAAKFPLVGITGISLIFYHLFGLPIGTVSLLLNIPIAILCYKLLGKNFMLRSLRTLIITSFIIDYVAPMFPIYEGDRLLAAICTSVLSGLGYALIYSRETSTGGSDFIIMAVRKVRPHLSFGVISFGMETIIIIAGTLAVSKSIEGLIYGVIINYISAAVIDKVMKGMDSGKTMLIVTDHAKRVAEAINHVSDRGCTFIKAEGSYSADEKDVVLCACSNREMVSIRRIVKETDPDSFTIIMDSTEVFGEGFKLEG